MEEYASRLVGVGPRAAARQAAALFALAGVLALAGTTATPGRTPLLLIIAAADLAAAAVAWWLPWHRWHPYAPLLLAVPAFAVLSVSTWAFGGFAAGTGPFFLLIYAWVGLNYPPRAIAATIPLALAAYVVPLIMAGQPPQVVSSAMILIPTAVGIGVLIAYQVRHQRRDSERIQQVEQWRAALTATLAHDLRSPLTTVHLVLDALRAEGDTIPAYQRDNMLASAIRQVGRMGRLAAGLLDAERVDSRGNLRLDVTDVPVRRLITDSLEQLNADHVIVEADPNLVVPADEQRLEQILINLVANALRHGRPPVIVRAVPTGGMARIEVRDHGPGVAKADQSRLFSRFNAADTNPDSVGLGLWIVRQLARAHGGDAGYEDADPGARIVVTLPLTPAGPSTRTPASSAAHS